MEKIVIIYILLAVVVLVVLAAGIYVRRKYPRPTDYRAVFYLGIMWIAIGLANDNHYLGLIAGTLFLITGLVNRKKWKENRFRWSDMSAEQKRIKIGVLTTIALATVTGVIVYIYS